MKIKKSISKQLSVAVGILSFTAFVIQGLGSTWGFEGVAEQLTQTALLFSGGINIYFLGRWDSDKKEEGNEKSSKKN